ncbi:hypothetical protein [Kordia sp.]
MEKFRKFELQNVTTIKIVGGNTSEDVPISTLGTISNDGDG